MGDNPLSVLIAVRDDELSADLKSMLATGDISRVHETRDAAGVFDLVRDNQIDLVLVADTPPELNGVALIRDIRTAKDSPNPDVLMFLLVETPSVNRLNEAVRAGVNEILLLPFGPDRLMRRISTYLVPS